MCPRPQIRLILVEKIDAWYSLGYVLVPRVKEVCEFFSIDNSDY